METRQGRRGRRRRRPVGMAQVAAALVVATVPVALSVSAGASPRSSPLAGPARAVTHRGGLRATGVCPFDDEATPSGESYVQVTTTGTLTGFAPGKRYYLYDDPVSRSTSGPVVPGSVVANSRGQLVLDARRLRLLGPSSDGRYPTPSKDSAHPSSTTLLHYLVSTARLAPGGGRVPDVVYRPPTTYAVNASCNPWTADGGTTVSAGNLSELTDGPLGLAELIGDNGVGEGDFGLFDKSDLLWTTHTFGADNRLVMQRDGNLVVYDGTRALWASHTAGHPGARLVLQLDHNLVISSAAGAALWATGTDRTP